MSISTLMETKLKTKQKQKEPSIKLVSIISLALAIRRMNDQMTSSVEAARAVLGHESQEVE
jgi:hypothetical protein